MVDLAPPHFLFVLGMPASTLPADGGYPFGVLPMQGAAAYVCADLSDPAFWMWRQMADTALASQCKALGIADRVFAYNPCPSSVFNAGNGQFHAAAAPGATREAVLAALVAYYRSLNATFPGAKLILPVLNPYHDWFGPTGVADGGKAYTALEQALQAVR